MDIIKSEAKLLTEEGNLISKIKGITEENYTMDEYVYKIEDIIKTKLKYFQDLKQKIKEYKSLLGWIDIYKYILFYFLFKLINNYIL